MNVNQKKKPAIDGVFTSLGSFEFKGSARVVVATTATDGYVIIDAVQFVAKRKTGR